MLGAHAAPGVQERHAPAGSQTMLAPQLVPAETSASVSTQVWAPVAHEVVPTWHGSRGVQASPAVHATHAPAPSQTRFVPQLVPAAIGGPSTQTGPVAQDIVPVSLHAVGVHAAPRVQARHAPVGSHTMFVPQLVPAVASAPVSTQVWAPVAHEVVPTWHGSAGVQASPAVHATHAPAPSQTWSVPQLVPAAIGGPSTQTGPAVHDIVPVALHAVGVQDAPGVQETHAPEASQTASVPQEVPGARSAPVSAHTAVPVSQEIVPWWQAVAGWHDVPQVTPRKSQLPVIVPRTPQSIMYSPWSRSGPTTGIPSVPRGQDV